MRPLSALKLNNVRFKLVLLFFFGFLYVMAIDYPEKSRQFPQLIALLSLATLVLSLVRDFLGKTAHKVEVAQVDDSELSSVDPDKKKRSRKRFYQAWGVIIVSTAAGLVGGFVFTTFFLFAGFAGVFGKKRDLLKNVVVALLMTAFIYFVFERLMGVPLLSGLLW